MIFQCVCYRTAAEKIQFTLCFPSVVNRGANYVNSDIMGNTNVFCGTAVAKRRCGPTALEQVAWLRLGPGPASNRDLHQVSLDILSNLSHSASLCWRPTGHFQDTYRSGYTFWDMLRTIFSQLNMGNAVLVPKDDAGRTEAGAA